MAAGEAAISTSLRGIWCPMEGLAFTKQSKISSQHASSTENDPSSEPGAGLACASHCWLLSIAVGDGCHTATGADSNPFHLMPSLL